MSIAQDQPAAKCGKVLSDPQDVVPQELILDRHGDPIERSELVRRAIDHAFRTRAVVAADINDQSVVELAQVFDGLDDSADFVVGVREVRPVNVRLPDKEFLLLPAEGIPLRQILRPRGQLCIIGHDPKSFLVGKDGVAQFVPAAVEQMHVADLLDPFRRRMMWRVCAARHVVHKEWFLGRDLLDLLHVLNRFVGHGCGQIPAGMALERIDGSRIAIQVWLPLACVPADEAIEVLEAHAVRPLVERAGLRRLVEGSVVILAKPRSCVAVLL